MATITPYMMYVVMCNHNCGYEEAVRHIENAQKHVQISKRLINKTIAEYHQAIQAQQRKERNYRHNWHLRTRKEFNNVSK